MDGNFDHVVELLAELRSENGYLKTLVTRLTDENRRLKRNSKPEGGKDV